MKSELFASLPDINFADKDPSQIENEIISQYETLADRTLARGDPVRVFFDSIILAIIQQRNIIDRAAKMNLLAYASGDYLDHIGAMLGVSRLPASHATTTASFALTEHHSFTAIIPSGTRITPDGKIFFETTELIRIDPNEHGVTCICKCTQAGEIGNGFVMGQINKLVDVFPYEVSVTNLTTSSGGTDIESDENYRERIQIAPESFTTAGSDNAYKYYARSAHSDIIDVAVLTPPTTQPGHVNIIPLMTGGNIPSDEIIQAVYDSCNAEDVRPDTDYLTVSKPEVVNYDINLRYWIDEKNSGSSAAIINKVEQAVNDFVSWQRISLGRDINPSELNKRVIEAGAKRCDIISPSFFILKKNQLAILNSKEISFCGLEEG